MNHLLRSSRSLARILPPSSSRHLRPVCRPLSVSYVVRKDAKGPHPSKPRAGAKVSEGVAEMAKEDETTKSGVAEEDESPSILAHHSTPDLFSLRDRTIIVAGGARGIGLTIARSILESGGNVIALDLLPNPSETEWPIAVELAKSKGLSLTYGQVDVTDAASLKTAFSQAFTDVPTDAPIRGMFVTAGIQLLMPAVDYTPEQLRKIIDVNTTGTFLCAQAFAREWLFRTATGKTPGIGEERGLATEGGASIVLTASMSGHVANKGLHCAAYNASKAAVHAMAKCFAMEWSKSGLRINTLSPGYIRTAMTATLLEQQPDLERIWLDGSLLGRLSTVDEFRGPAIYLLSDASSFMTGADLLVDGGHTAT